MFFCILFFKKKYVCLKDKKIRPKDKKNYIFITTLPRALPASIC